MNKKSHVLITKKVTENIPERGRMWFLLGSILPDLLLHTYLKGHTWESAFEHISGKMYELERNGRNDWYSYLMLGYILHYIEDFYTFAHNQVFEGGLAKHIRYEKALAKYLGQEGTIRGKKRENRMSLSVTMAYLEKTHREYLKEAGNFETDAVYIYKAAEAVSSCMLWAFEVNSREDESTESVPVDVISDYRKVRL